MTDENLDLGDNPVAPSAKEIEDKLRQSQKEEVSPETVNVFGEEKDVPDEQQASARLNEVAREVLAGDWGIGQERRRRLTEAGFDHVEVQREMVRVVNKQT